MFARELAEDGNRCGEYDDTPDDFGRIAATTAKQIILQRLRDAEDELRYGEFSGKEGDIVSGVIQQGRDPDDVMVDLGKIEAVLPPPEQVPGEKYEHGDAAQVHGRLGPEGHERPADHVSRTHPNLVKKLFALEVPEIADGTVEITAIAREAGHRTKIAVRTLTPSSTARAPASARWASGCATSCTSCTARRSTSSTTATTRPTLSRMRCPRRRSRRWRWSTLQQRSARVVVPDFQLSLAIGKEGQNARLAARLTGWRIDIRSDEAPTA